MRKKILTRIGIAIISVLVLLQFIPMTKNNGSVDAKQHISACLPIPNEVEQVLKTSCNDCHSNVTEYPWYSRIQPVGFWLNHHVDEGKHELNFSEFAGYTKKRQLHKLDEMIEMVEAGEMPLNSYTVIHKNAILSNNQIMLLVQWAKASKQYLQRDSVTAL